MPETNRESIDTTVQRQTVIVGGGLAGLTAARQLAAEGKTSIVLESSDRVGGRVRTDTVDGLQLDHGFQVLLTAYPVCRQWLDYDALRLRVFEPGALVRVRGRFSRLGDPWRRPTQALSTALSPVGSFADKLRIAKLRLASSKGTLADLYHRPSESTLQRLRAIGFSDVMIDQFFRPFLGGVFLDESLATSSRMLEFVFRMFAAGDIAVPADGMAAIPRQLADGLPRGTLHLQQTVSHIETGDEHHVVHLTNGTALKTKHVVVATESNAAAKLLGKSEWSTEWNQTTVLYFVADRSPESSKLLMLRGDEDDCIQTAVVMSDVAPEYASKNRSLISITVSDRFVELPTEQLESQVRSQAQRWFGQQADRWECVQTIRVPYGLPARELDPVEQPVDTEVDRLFVCGDHRETPSIQGAMNSGMRVARQILADSPS